MKCPKCGYVGFEETQRCRHCGYEFALAVGVEPPVERTAAVRAAAAAADPGSLADEFFAPQRDAEVPSLDRLGFVDLQTFDAADAVPLADLPLADPPLAGSSPVDPSSADPSSVASSPLDGSVAEPPPSLNRPLPSDLFASPLPARPPLAVRRATERPRSRPTTQVVRRAPAGLLDADVPVSDTARPEAVPTTGPGAASILARLGAGAIDLALLGGIALVVVYFTVRLAGLTMAQLELLPVPPLAAFLLGLSVAYLAAFTACGGQTLGKMAAGLRVVADDGAVAPGTAAVRSIAALAGGFLGGLGFLPALFDADHRGLHDRLTGTRVVRR